MGCVMDVGKMGSEASLRQRIVRVKWTVVRYQSRLTGLSVLEHRCEECLTRCVVYRGRASVLCRHRKAAGAEVELRDRTITALAGAQRGVRVQQATEVIDLSAEAVDTNREPAASESLSMRREVHGECTIGVGVRNRAACKKRLFKVMYKSRWRYVVGQR